MKFSTALSRRVLQKSFLYVVLLLATGIFQSLEATSSRLLVLQVKHIVNYRTGPATNKVPSENLSISYGEYYHYVLLTWAKHPEADFYELRRRKANSNEDWELVQTIGKADNLQVRDNIAEPGIEYEYNLRSIKIDLATQKRLDLESQTGTGLRKQKTLSQPQPGPKPQAGLPDPPPPAGRALLEWSPVSGADYYRLQIVSSTSASLSEDNQSNASFDLIDKVVLDTFITSTTYRFIPDSEDRNALFWWRVRAENDLEFSDYSDFIRVEWRASASDRQEMELSIVEDFFLPEKKMLKEPRGFLLNSNHSVTANKAIRERIEDLFGRTRNNSGAICWEGYPLQPETQIDDVVIHRLAKAPASNHSSTSISFGVRLSSDLITHEQNPNSLSGAPLLTLKKDLPKEENEPYAFQLFVHDTVPISFQLFRIKESITGKRVADKKDLQWQPTEPLLLWNGKLPAGIYDYTIRLKMNQPTSCNLTGRIIVID